VVVRARQASTYVGSVVVWVWHVKCLVNAVEIIMEVGIDSTWTGRKTPLMVRRKFARMRR